ncbi:unnamed protein product [Trichobilharzia regenti]|nr:unnamed protein product [Trichobilharzia regenti]
MCEVLISTKQWTSLRHLFNQIPKFWLTYEEEHFSAYYHRYYYHDQNNNNTTITTNNNISNIKFSENISLNQLFESRESIIKALAMLSYEEKNFSLVYHLLQSNHFTVGNQATLQQLWYNTHYAEVQLSRDKPLTAVDKYRIRRKHPLPQTIWDGQEIVYCFKRNVRCQLKEFYRKNQYPSSTEKYAIAMQTGLTFTQVCNWFKNHRQRDKPIEITDAQHQTGSATFISDENTIKPSCQKLNKSTNNINNNKSNKQNQNSMKAELQIEIKQINYDWQRNIQSFNVQHQISPMRYNSSFGGDLNYAVKHEQDLEYDQLSNLYPITSSIQHKYSSGQNSNQLLYGECDWTTDYFHIHQNNNNSDNRNNPYYHYNYHNNNQYEYHYMYDDNNNNMNINSDSVNAIHSRNHHVHEMNTVREAYTSGELNQSHLHLSNDNLNSILYTTY